MSKHPRISILTPSFQQATYLEECILSVRQQVGAEVEHIVMDGGSTDGSKAVIQKHAAGLHWWCSQPDGGQSASINKGLAHATGEVFTWVNSDDALLPGALAKVSDAFASDPDLLVFGGRLIFRDATDDRTFEPLNDASDELRSFCDPVINQPATFIKVDAVRAVGGVDPALRYVMDVELWWRLMFRYGVKHMRFEPVELAMFRLHATSKTTTAHAGFLDELASLLHGMCMATGQAALALALAVAHKPIEGLRGVPVGEEQAAMVRNMAVHFLLKWHGQVHRREDFAAMKALKRAVRPSDLRFVNEAMAARWVALDKQLAGSTWFTFRLRRKLKHMGR